MKHRSISTPIGDALLFLSRANVPTCEIEHAQEICSRVQDWMTFIATANRKFSLPFVYRNLQRLELDDSYAPILTAMRSQVMAITFASLRALAAQQKFHVEAVMPLEVPHVYLKGPSLAVRYYDDPGLRFARDIDILLSREDQKKLVYHALSCGYLIVDNGELKDHRIDPRDLKALLTYNTVITLVTRENFTIEVHRSIDKKLGLFSVEDVLSRREVLSQRNFEYSVMPTEDLFCYICYHNTRHTWSRLHWIADLDAIISCFSFDRKAALARAGELGLYSCVEACLELHEIAISGDANKRAKGSSRGAELAEICLLNLSGDLELEYQLRESKELLDIPFSWMVSSGVRKRAMIQTRLSRIYPSYEDYAAWRLPHGLQWIYFISKPLDLLKRKLSPLPNRDS